MKLAERVAVITGAGSGIGRAITEVFAREGARILAVDRDRGAVEHVVAAVASGGGTGRSLVANVSDADAARRAIAALIEAWATLTCSSHRPPSPWAERSRPSRKLTGPRSSKSTVKGTYLWARAVLPHMMEARKGSIITIASQLALAGGHGSAGYVASKGAVISLTRSIANDYAAYGIRANVLIPGAVETPMLERSFLRQPDPEEARRASRQRHLLGRFGTPREVALAALFLASDDSSFTTGAKLLVNGGWLAG